MILLHVILPTFYTIDRAINIAIYRIALFLLVAANPSNSPISPKNRLNKRAELFICTQGRSTYIILSMRAQSTPPPLKHPLHTVQSGQDAQLNNTLALHRYWYLVHVAPPHTSFVTLARAAFTVHLLPPFFLPLLLLDMYAFLNLHIIHSLFPHLDVTLDVALDARPASGFRG